MSSRHFARTWRVCLIFSTWHTKCWQTITQNFSAKFSFSEFQCTSKNALAWKLMVHPVEWDNLKTNVLAGVKSIYSSKKGSGIFLIASTWWNSRCSCCFNLKSDRCCSHRERKSICHALFSLWCTVIASFHGTKCFCCRFSKFSTEGRNFDKKRTILWGNFFL